MINRRLFFCGSNKLRTYHIEENNEFIFKFRIKLNPHISVRLESILLPDTAKKPLFIWDMKIHYCLEENMPIDRKLRQLT